MLLIDRPATFWILIWLSMAVSEPAAAQFFDWRSATGSESTYQLSVDGITAKATAYVAELAGGNPVLGPFTTSSGSLAAGFNQDVQGIGLWATPVATSASISGSEECCGLVFGGINSDAYLSGDTSIEAMNFVVFEFDADVAFTSMTLVGVTSQNRASWIATGTVVPDLTGSIEQALTGFTVVNLPDPLGSGGPRTFTLQPSASYRYLLVGASPEQPVGDIDAVAITGNFRIQSFDSVPAPTVPSVTRLGIVMLGSLLGLAGWRRLRG